MKKLFILFAVMCMPLMAKADMLDISNPASPLSPFNMTNPLNPASPFNMYYNPISPYYIGDDENTPPVVTKDKKGVVVIIGNKDKIQKIKRYQNCIDNCGGNACLDLLK